MDKVCTVAGCGKHLAAKGLCAMHYRRNAIHGTTDLVVLPRKSRLKSMVGQRFNRLEIVEMIYGKPETKVVCKCDCGVMVTALPYNVRNGNTSSCGCLAREQHSALGKRQGPIQGKLNATHGMTNTPTYTKWLDARKRCFREKDLHYAEYGGRGITMDARWAESFEEFLGDMGEAPKGMTLERLDVNGNYAPGNCIWTTLLQQARNKRTSVATWEIVCEIRRRAAAGESVASLSREFNMTSGNAHHIVHGTTWKTQF